MISIKHNKWRMCQNICLVLQVPHRYEILGLQLYAIPTIMVPRTFTR